MAGGRRSLGAVIADLRTRNGWTLKEMSELCGIPVSTLSKVEHDRLSLTYDKLQQLGERLNISIADLFAEGEGAPATIMGRRSVGTLDRAVRVDTPNYEYYYLCTELRQKRMVPVISRIHAQSLGEFGQLLRHSGEEFIFVVDGAITVHTEFYEPLELKAGESIYIDSGMGHAYVCAPGHKETTIVSVMSSAEEDLSSLIHEAQRKTASGDETAQKKRASRKE
ncbi:helix-turn-helix domain-containing protein [Novosphingobium aerophilum]|uniref:helix-turn-helix domain-containing protein n=1 Tax=Novosphingobium TaxID=165696 RepID=UPI0006C8399E|nr:MULTISPECIES: XRE family transcriptional regulator [unclassified Novosphingobium]KPH66267.1 XRE family transcriptional regulator [Novosphingobium sp. ST904]TCM38760.1 XRE family transcriptional regulator [Novosphingobium sp. ST904]WRT95807.1 XRE family transcriptional regulator [Novosphingobium sp. RL4]